jgi:hypothetical protein
MLYIFGVGTALILIILFLRYRNDNRKKELLKNLRQQWGLPKNTDFLFSRIEKYDTFTPGEGFHRLSEQTLNDIDFNELFSFIDRTTSSPGQQYLYKKLKHPSASPVSLRQFDSKVSFFSDHSSVREEVQEQLSRLSHRDAYFISSLLQDKLLEKPWWYRFLKLSAALVIVLLILSLKFPVLLIFLILPAGLNMLLHYWNKTNSFQFARSFPQLNVLIHAAGNITRKDASLKNENVEKSIGQLRYFQSKSALLALGTDAGLRDELSGIFTYFIELLKAVFLVEVFVLYHLIRELETKKNDIRNLFDYVGDIDSAISVSSLRAGATRTCIPNLTAPSGELEVKNIIHPLIGNCVPNDIAVHSRGILITGSNMSGKTTFLRTLIINSILAQTIHTCFADEFRSPVLKQFSSIRIDDSIMDARSYYLEEVMIMGGLIREGGSDAHNLFVLDEVFKGTNTAERVAAAKAILSYLNRENNIVIVSTHDGELSDLLSNEYDLYHFTETIEANHLQFDHRIKPGRLKTRNAIKILELSGYPEEIILEATELSKSILRR